MNGKGSRRRPEAVSAVTLADRWAATFGKGDCERCKGSSAEDRPETVPTPQEPHSKRED